ncbi:TetR/AcrR family transcriptional regulator [Isoptericola sp. NPDC019693]|uniref:TetR/AcrR family transcriptional regulator n=1 Tax=Isoptericola sp. NPDC019693 TaxID=3364009 RepID=UPI0037A169B3
MSEARAAEPVRRRPRDRRQTIEAAAAVAFAERGYHRVAMQDVADAVGITAAALYRHFDNKYELFREIAMDLVARLTNATAAVTSPADRTPGAARADAEAVLDAVSGETVAMRSSGNIYRWESRYLRPEDRKALAAEFTALRCRLSEPAATLRPDLDPATLDLVALAALSVIASVTAHRTPMAVGPLQTLLREAALRVLTDAPGPAPSVSASGDGDAPDEAGQPGRRRDQLAQAGIAAFARRGYHEASIEEIAAAVGLTPSGVYRHFSGKSEILRTACERAAATLDAAAEDALGHPDPREALRSLEAAYVRFAVEDRDLMDVYTADVGALDPEDQRRLRRLQRAHVDDWVELLERVRPGGDPRELRFLVHAGFNVVADLSVALRRSPGPEAKRWIGAVLETVLGA